MERWKVKKDEQLARTYFEGIGASPVASGILSSINSLVRVAAQAEIDFELLLELAAENDFSLLGEHVLSAENACDLIDDELLSLHIDPYVNSEGDAGSYHWVDEVFRGSLAAIQAASSTASGSVSADDAIRLLVARVRATLRAVPDPAARKAIVSSGLPFRTALRAQIEVDSLVSIADAFLAGGSDLSALVDAVGSMERWARASAANIVKFMPAEAELEQLREFWVRGVALRELMVINKNAARVCSELYGYQLPWIMHAISQQLAGDGDVVRAEVFSSIALRVELGVPTDLAAKLYLSGILSRAASTELADLLDGDIQPDWALGKVTRYLRDTDVVRMLKASADSELPFKRCDDA